MINDKIKTLLNQTTKKQKILKNINNNYNKTWEQTDEQILKKHKIQSLHNSEDPVYNKIKNIPTTNIESLIKKISYIENPVKTYITIIKTLFEQRKIPENIYNFLLNTNLKTIKKNLNSHKQFDYLCLKGELTCYNKNVEKIPEHINSSIQCFYKALTTREPFFFENSRNYFKYI